MNNPLCAYWEEKLALRPEDLSPSDRAALDIHLRECSTCSEIQASNLRLIRQFRALPPLSKKGPPERLFQPKESEGVSGVNLTSIPDFDNISAFIKERVDAMRAPVPQWADLARLAVQGLPHDTYRLAELEALINSIRAELRSVVIAASEHFSDEQLNKLRKDVGMSKYAWRALKKQRPITTKYGLSHITEVSKAFQRE